MSTKKTVGLVGYGKMGKSIDTLIQNPAHPFHEQLEVVWRVNGEQAAELDQFLARGADVIIEFSNPKSAFTNIMAALKHQIPVISGTTGWLDKYEAVVEETLVQDGAFLYGSNFSIGVNIFFEINRKLAALMSSYPDYKVRMTEIHHIHKKDAPSGTAITLANDIILQHDQYQDWVLGTEGSEDTIPINDIREGEVSGTHTIEYQSHIDSICIKHEAFSRQGFAWGACLAANWIVGKQGIFSMKDVLNLS